VRAQAKRRKKKGKNEMNQRWSKETIDEVRVMEIIEEVKIVMKMIVMTMRRGADGLVEDNTCAH